MSDTADKPADAPATENAAPAPAAAAPAPAPAAAADPKAIDKTHWVADKDATACHACKTAFSMLNRRHHCRQCGQVFCGHCSFFRAICEKVPGAPERLCESCVLEVAFRATKLTREGTGNKIGPVEVGTNKEDTFEGVTIEKGDQIAAVRGGPNAKINLINCHIDGVEKGSNGHVHLTNCVITGNKPLQISGNNTLVLKNCVVLGGNNAVLLTANAKMEANDTYFIATSPNSLAIDCQANAGATLTNCVATGSNGVLLQANAKLVSQSSIISCQTLSGALGMLSPHFAISGKHELKDSTVVGGVKDRNAGLTPLQKIGEKLEPKPPSSSAPAASTSAAPAAAAAPASGDSAPAPAANTEGTVEASA